MQHGFNKDFQDDFTEGEVLACLDRAGLRYRDGGRYITAQCPTHDDSSPSAQIFKNDWFVNCLSGCGRYHITKAFPELQSRHHNRQSGPFVQHMSRAGKKAVVEQEYKNFDLMERWKAMPPIPRDHQFKNLPLTVLDDLGWRWDGGSYFIPYFDGTKAAIPFGQWRHLSGERRFTFLKDAKPRAYGIWNLQRNLRIFLVEGASDAAVLQHCMVPWIAMPSASSVSIVKELAKFCKSYGIEIVYAGDKDEAGDKLKEALGEVIPFRTCQPPAPYKDYGEFYVATDVETVFKHCKKILFE